MEHTRFLVVPRQRAASPAPTVKLSNTNTRYLTEVLVTSLALGYVFDVLFYGQALGISVPIFVVLFVVGLGAVMRVRGLPLARRNLWLLAPLLFFAIMVPFRANAQLTWLNVSAVVVIAALLVYFLAAGKSWELGLAAYPATVAVVGTRVLVAPVPAIGAARKGIPNRQRARRMLAILRGVVLALPVLIVFGALLASADRFFAQFLMDTFRLKGINNFGETMWRIVIMLGVAWVVAGALLFATARGTEPQAPAHTRRFRLGTLVGAGEGATILALVNVLFAIFAWIQFTNIFLGKPSTIDYEGYRDYVRRGFGELLLVCVLTLLLILTVRRIADFRSPRALLFYRLLTTVMVALTGVMLLSASKRMEVWQEVMFYINTPLRIYVTVFIVWLAALFGWLLLTVWLGTMRFGVGALLAAIGFMVTVNMINPDANVAAANLAREDELSTRYLHLLSDDAMPTLAQALDTMPDLVVRERLREHLGAKLAQIEANPSAQSWPAFHFSKAQAYATLKSLKAEGKLERTGHDGLLLMRGEQ